MKTYEIENTSPTVEEFKYLCESVGWSDFINFEVVETSLKNSIYCVTVRENEQIVGMGRIVGDGAIYFYIQDIVVHPTYQNNGIGKEIMKRLVDFLHTNAPDQAFIGLFASQGNESFYEKFDFEDYSPNMTGMFTVISKKIK